MTVLVTGGAGFIGTHLVPRLVARGDAVRVFDLRAPRAPVARVDYRQGCITDTDAVRAAMVGCEQVFHLAALSGMWAPDKSRFVHVNEIGTRTVLNEALRAGVGRVVHTSTESILIATRGVARPQRIDETTAQPEREMAGAYCRGKWRAEQVAWRAVAAGQDVVVVNPTIPIGPGDPWQTPASRMLLGFLDARFPAYLDSTINLVDVRDVADAHLAAAERAQPGERCLVSGQDLDFGTLIGRLAEVSGRELRFRRIPYAAAYAVAVVSEFLSDHLTRRPPAAPLTGVRIARIPVEFDNRRTRMRLGWSPRPLDQTLSDAIADFEARGWLA